MSGVSVNSANWLRLISFYDNIQPFIEGAKYRFFDYGRCKGVGRNSPYSYAADILDGLTSWFTGGSSMTKFGRVSEFGPHFNAYYESIKGVDGSVVESSANAAKALARWLIIYQNKAG